MTAAIDDRHGSFSDLYRFRPELLTGLFRRWNRVMVGMFRVGLGPYIGNPYSGYIMVIGTRGRKSGRLRRTPVNFSGEDGYVYCMSGFGPASDWYRNATVEPRVQVWVGGEGWSGTAETVQDPVEWLRAYRATLRRAGFADRAFTKANLTELDDQSLLSRAPGAPVVRVRLEERLAGKDAPGDLRWVWLFPAGWLVLKLLRRRRA